MSTSDDHSAWGSRAPSLAQSTWIGAIRHSPPWLRRPLQRAFQQNVQPSWSAPLDIECRQLKFRCHFDDNAPERKLLFQGRRFDHWHLDQMRPLLQPGATFVDIGANFGFYALNAARMMRGRGAILAIEPNAVMAARLRENIALNAITTIVVNEVAIGAAEGRASCHASLTDHGSSQYASAGSSPAGACATVRMMPLLDAVRAAGLDRIDVLKIDIEGYEDQALAPFFKSAPQALWPRMIVMEQSQKDRWTSDLTGELLSQGYQIIAKGRVDLVLMRTV
jgi:FkbM family methyltransferase